jgi:hypothetical protein
MKKVLENSSITRRKQERKKKKEERGEEVFAFFLVDCISEDSY